MSRRSAGAAAMVVLTVTIAFAQQNPVVNAPAAGAPAAAPTPATQPTPMYRWGRNAMGNRQSGPVNAPSLQQRIQDLQATMDKMHVVLKQMHTKAAANPKDPIAKSNLEMWDLMIKQLDSQLQELKQAEASRADLETRRAAMYKQADIKSQGAPKAGQQSMFVQQPTGTVSGQSAGQGSTAPAQAGSQTPGPSSAAQGTSTAPSGSASPN